MGGKGWPGAEWGERDCASPKNPHPNGAEECPMWETDRSQGFRSRTLERVVGTLRGPAEQHQELEKVKEGADGGLCSAALGMSTAPTDTPLSLAALGLSEIFPDRAEEPGADLRRGGQQTQLLRGQHPQQGRAICCQEGEGDVGFLGQIFPILGTDRIDINVQWDRLLPGWVWREVGGGCVGRAGLGPPKLRCGSVGGCFWGAGTEPRRMLVLTCGFAQSPCALSTALGCVCAMRELEL